MWDWTTSTPLSSRAPHADTRNCLLGGRLWLLTARSWQMCGHYGPEGYTYHDVDGNPLINYQRFPSFQKMTTKAHGLGLTSGWYGNNCICSDNKTADKKFYAGDVKAMRALGFDSWKLDGCGAQTDMQLWHDLIEETPPTTGRKAIMVENCHWGSRRPYEPNATWCPWNFYRTSGDVRANYVSALWRPRSPPQASRRRHARVGSDALARLRSCSPGFGGRQPTDHREVRDSELIDPGLLGVSGYGESAASLPAAAATSWILSSRLAAALLTLLLALWQLEVGVLASPFARDKGLTIEETRAHFGSWAIVSSPLTLSHDPSNQTIMDAIWPIISNTEVLSVSQSYAGHSGSPFKQAAATLELASTNPALIEPSMAADELASLPPLRVPKWQVRPCSFTHPRGRLPRHICVCAIYVHVPYMCMCHICAWYVHGMCMCWLPRRAPRTAPHAQPCWTPGCVVSIRLAGWPIVPCTALRPVAPSLGFLSPRSDLTPCIHPFRIASPCPDHVPFSTSTSRWSGVVQKPPCC